MRQIDGPQFFWLVTMAIIASITALFVDESVYTIANRKCFRISLLTIASQLFKDKGKYNNNYWIWIPVSLAFAAAATAIITFVSPQAAGSGIPQMKAIMVGVKLPQMLTFRTYVAKVFGMIAMLSTGLPLGKEGPFVHIASCIANSLPYKEMEFNKTIKHQFLSAAVAVGVATTFGAPIGGMLFAIEVTSTQFTVNNLWKSFFASTISVLCFKAFGFLSEGSLFAADASYFYSGKAAVGINHEQPFFVILGILSGCLGSLYIRLQRAVNTFKSRQVANKNIFFSNNWIYTLGVTFIITNVIYFTKLL